MRTTGRTTRESAWHTAAVADKTNSTTKKKKAKKLTMADVRRALPDGMTVRRSRCGDGEVVVNFHGGLIETAYYTDDLSDALATAKTMDAQRLRDAHKSSTAKGATVRNGSIFVSTRSLSDAVECSYYYENSYVIQHQSFTRLFDAVRFMYAIGFESLSLTLGADSAQSWMLNINRENGVHSKEIMKLSTSIESMQEAHVKILDTLQYVCGGDDK